MTGNFSGLITAIKNVFKYLFILSLAITLTVLLSFVLYRINLNIADSTNGLSTGTLMRDYGRMINYLSNPFVKDLKFIGMSSSKSGLEHFAEVKKLFLLNYTVLIIGMILLAAKKMTLKLNKIEVAWLAFIPMLFFLTAVGNFESFFIMFHHAFFRNSNWLFDPSTDPIINTLTEDFFAWCFLAFFIILELIIYACYKQKRKTS